MANLNSSGMANVLATPQVMNFKDNSQKSVVKEYLNVTTSNLNLNDIWYVCELPWNACIDSILFANAAKLDTATSMTMDVGIYELRQDGTINSVAPTCYLSAGTQGQSINAYPGVELAAAVKTFDLFNQDIATDAGYNSNTAFVDGFRGSKAILGIKVHAAPGTAQASKCLVVVRYTM